MLVLPCLKWYNKLQFLQTYRKALVILPFVAIVQEKAESLSKALAGMGCPVKGFFGSEDSNNCQPLAERWIII